jgi:hypothetical protein
LRQFVKARASQYLLAQIALVVSEVEPQGNRSHNDDIISCIQLVSLVNRNIKVFGGKTSNTDWCKIISNCGIDKCFFAKMRKQLGYASVLID